VRGGGPRAPEEALLESREAACLADEDVSDLAHLDADEEHSVASVLLVQTLPECLWTGVGAGDKKEQSEPRHILAAPTINPLHFSSHHSPGCQVGGTPVSNSLNGAAWHSVGRATWLS
jgi:hypothetical protein